MSKPWIERTLFTEFQKVTMMPSEDRSCVILKSEEIEGNKEFFRLYLTFGEARAVANQLDEYADELELMQGK